MLKWLDPLQASPEEGTHNFVAVVPGETAPYVGISKYENGVFTDNNDIIRAWRNLPKTKYDMTPIEFDPPKVAWNDRFLVRKKDGTLVVAYYSKDGDEIDRINPKSFYNLYEKNIEATHYMLFPDLPVGIQEEWAVQWEHQQALIRRDVFRGFEVA